MSDWTSISVVMITRNTESTLAAALRSIPTGADIIIADADSTDQTVSIASSFGAQVIRQDRNLITAAGGNFDVARNQAIDVACSKWVFILDSDEQLTEELAGEIAEVIRMDKVHAAYDMPRQNLFWGKEVRLLGEDRQIRLLQRGKGRYEGYSLHCPICIEGTIGQLAWPLIHHNITSFSDVRRRFRRYLPIERQSRTSTTSPLGALRHICHMARYYLVHQQAWRDGWRGIFTSCIFSVYHGLALWTGKK